MRKGMEDDLSFRRVFSSSNGSMILEVIHESSKSVDDRVHSPSYMAFVNMKEALPGTFEILLRASAEVHESFNGTTELLRTLWIGDEASLTFFKLTEPLMGFYHDTYWFAKAAIEIDEDPMGLLVTFEKVARSERNAKEREMASVAGSKHFDKLAKAIDRSKARGRLPIRTVTFVEEIGGGAQALAVHFVKGHTSDPNAGYENLYLWLTDFEGIMIGIYDKSDRDDECHAIYLKGENGFEELRNITDVVATLESLVRFGRLFTELY